MKLVPFKTFIIFRKYHLDTALSDPEQWSLVVSRLINKVKPEPQAGNPTGIKAGFTYQFLEASYDKPLAHHLQVNDLGLLSY